MLSYLTSNRDFIATERKKVQNAILKLLTDAKVLTGDLGGSTTKIKKFFGIGVSHQTIENWLFVNENVLEFDLGRFSGYYIFNDE
jgi:hypothetical protein